ncbi:hypothetical protein NQU17_11765 [Clostridiaceae bacterium HFYG-1003]|nr:hypothetical protein NQU17_11765 [Clostridiaceae bacterium HFYG-1003]
MIWQIVEPQIARQVTRQQIAQQVTRQQFPEPLLSFSVFLLSFPLHWILKKM